MGPRDLAGTNPSLLADVGPKLVRVVLSRSTLERLACDCKFNRVLMDGPSQVLDVGRITRNIPELLWQALVARDKHCTHKGCTRGPGHCEAHHIRYWTNGGPTNLDNLRLLCWYHHRELHLADNSPRPPRITHQARAHSGVSARFSGDITFPHQSRKNVV